MKGTTRRDWLLGAATLVAAGCSSGARPIAPRPAAKPIVVVGAGLAGLTAALDLVEAGRDVLVLEAQGRPGGRILTLRKPFDEGLYVEAGATHVIGDPDLLALLAKLGIRVANAKGPRGLATIDVHEGRRTRFAGDDEPPSRDVLSDEEKKLGFLGCLDKYFASVKGVDPALPWPPPALARHDAQAGDRLLSEVGASPGYIEAFGFTGEKVGKVSGAFLLREIAGFFRDKALAGGGRIEGGSDRLPVAIASRLGARVVYGAEVKRIAHGADGVRIAFVRGGELSQVDAERVVCALPYSVLRHVEVAPAFSPPKTRAIRELRMVSVARVLAQVDRRIWLDRGEAGDADTDLPMGGVRDETRLQPGTMGVLGAYASADAARRITALPEAERLRLFLEGAETVHPGARAHYVRGITHCWDEDPFARGAYAWFAPGEMAALGPALASAEGRVHFAGDHTSHRPGWMHGALASAKRASREVLTARARES